MTATPGHPANGTTPGGFHPSGVEWLRGEGAHADVVLSSRVRLARNLAGFPFASRADETQRLSILDLSREAIRQSLRGTQAGTGLLWLNVHDTAPAERALLVERHLISKQLQRGRAAAVGEDPRGAAVSLPAERVSIMVNEEDHIRIQVVRSGLDLAEAWKQASEIDDALESVLEYAYSPRLGFLTACPTNLGTGMRMSVMLHLPALRMTGDIEKVKKAASDMCLAVRGFYGEGSEAAGDLYQISNQTTLGKTEAMVLAEMHEHIIPQVAEYERVARRTLLAKRTPVLQDQVFRALGTVVDLATQLYSVPAETVERIIRAATSLATGPPMAPVRTQDGGALEGSGQRHLGRHRPSHARAHAGLRLGHRVPPPGARPG
jgi:protein arginine kinase